MIQYKLLKLSSRMLRLYRTRVTLDWHTFESFLPQKGQLLDVGCGVGLLAYEIAQMRPALNILGIDISQENISFARDYHSLPNVQYQFVRLEALQGQFDYILFVDVFHHVPLAEHGNLLRECARLLVPGGHVLIKDIERRRGQFSWFMDHYVSGVDEVYLQNCDELLNTVMQYFDVICFEVRYRFPFPHFYIKARL